MIINTNVSALIGLNNLRKTDNGLRIELERLSSGLRVNKAADDPSGLAIATGMNAQIRGIQVATQNAEDTKNLIHTADGALEETTNILLRMRDLAVRSANEATLTSADMARLNSEFRKLVDEIDRKSKAVTFNNKRLFSGYSYKMAQIGPGQNSFFRITIAIRNLNAKSIVFSTTGADNYTSVYNASISNASVARVALSRVQLAIYIVGNVRARLGIQERRLDHIIDDLAAMQINISAAKSRIMDAEMGAEIAEFTRLQIIQQSGTAVLAQANMSPAGILQLLRY